MHDFFRMNDPSAKRLAYALVPETNAQYGNPALIMLNHWNRDSGFTGRAGSGRDNDSYRVQPLDIIEIDLIITKYGHVFTQFAKILHQVIGEGIVIVDHQ